MILPVDITLRSKHTIYSGFPAKDEIAFPEESVEHYRGLMSIRGKKVKFEFAPPQRMQNFDEKTVVSVSKDDVLISRVGSQELNMVFCKNNSCECVFLDPHRQLNIKIKTAKLDNSLSRHGGSLDIDYTVEIFGSLAEGNSLSFSVLPVDKIS